MKKSVLFLSTLALLSLCCCGNNPVVPASSIDESSAQASSNPEKTKSEDVKESSKEGATSTAESSVEESSIGESSSERSSEDDGLVTIKTIATPDMAPAVKFDAIQNLNSVFALMPGTQIDTTGEAVTIDGKTYPKQGRFKLNGESASTFATKKSIRITTNGAGTLRFIAKSANSTDASRKWAIGTVKDGEPTTLFKSEDGVALVSTAYTYEIKEAGTYYLFSPVNGFNLYYLDFVQRVKLGEETGFEVNPTSFITDYIPGDSLDTSSIRAAATYSSGAKVDLDPSKFTIDASAVNMNTPGTYDLLVKYKDYAAKVIKVTVFSVTGLKIHAGIKQESAGGNKIHRTYRVLPLNGTFDASYISYKAVVEGGKELPLDPSKVSNSGVDSTTAGKKSFTATFHCLGNDYTDSFSVTVIDASTLEKSEGAYKVSVDSSIANEGEKVGSSLAFSCVQNAHDFLKLALGATNSDRKVINVKAGTYEEKDYIEIPNLSLLGEGKDVTEIKFAADADTVDDGGTAYSTYGSGTLMVLGAATSFHAEKLALNNSKFTSMKEYKDSKDGNKQACALTCDADLASFSEVKFLGYQDTLLANKNSQYYVNCEIIGMTDFIFGQDSDALFESCTIRSLDRGSSTNGGYICAPKPAAKKDIGFTFINCSLLAESTVTEGTVSLARPWGSAATVNYVNCAMANHISKKAQGDTSSSKNARWEAMSGNLPDKAYFAEYGSTGEGAIVAAVKGGSILDEEGYLALTAKVTAFKAKF